MISSEIFQQLLSYVRSIHENEQDLYVRKDMSSTEIHLSALAALSEEFGELATEVRRMEKVLFSHSKSELAHPDKVIEEGLDVIICTLILLQKYSNESLDSHILKKISKNNERGY